MHKKKSKKKIPPVGDTNSGSLDQTPYILSMRYRFCDVHEGNSLFYTM